MRIIRRRRSGGEVRRVDVAVSEGAVVVHGRRRGWDATRLRAEIEGEFRSNGARVWREEGRP